MVSTRSNKEQSISAVALSQDEALTSTYKGGSILMLWKRSNESGDKQGSDLVRTKLEVG